MKNNKKVKQESMINKISKYISMFRFENISIIAPREFKSRYLKEREIIENIPYEFEIFFPLLN